MSSPTPPHRSRQRALAPRAPCSTPAALAAAGEELPAESIATATPTRLRVRPPFVPPPAPGENPGEA